MLDSPRKRKPETSTLRRPAQIPRLYSRSTPLKKGQISTASLRDEFRKDRRYPFTLMTPFSSVPSLEESSRGIMFIGATNCYAAGKSRASIVIDEQSFVFTMQFAKEKNIWPRPVATVTLPGAELGMTGRSALPDRSSPAPPPPPPGHHRRGCLESSTHRTLGKGPQGKSRHSSGLSIRLFEYDAFRMLGRENTEKGCETGETNWWLCHQRRRRNAA